VVSTPDDTSPKAATSLATLPASSVKPIPQFLVLVSITIPQIKQKLEKEQQQPQQQLQNPQEYGQHTPNLLCDTTIRLLCSKFSCQYSFQKRRRTLQLPSCDSRFEEMVPDDTVRFALLNSSTVLILTQRFPKSCLKMACNQLWAHHTEICPLQSEDAVAANGPIPFLVACLHVCTEQKDQEKCVGISLITGHKGI
jgi:hypothetical protein